MATTDQLLNLDGISVRSEGVRYDLLDASGNLEGVVHPYEFPTVEHNATAGDVKRRLTNFRLPADESAWVDTLTHRIRPVWLLENGAEFPLGVFLFADASTARRPWGVEVTSTLFDQGLILGQDLSRYLSFDPGTNHADAIAAVAAAAGIAATSIDATTGKLETPLSFPMGRGSTGAKAIDHLCSLAGFHPAYFTSSGVLRARTAVTDPSTVEAQLVYADGARIIDDSTTESNDLLKGPNRFIAIDTTATSAAIAATYDLPSSAPNSVARRGFAIPFIVEAPGAGTYAAALAVAQNAAATAVKAYEEVTFSSTPDPRHESFDVVSFRGANYLELEWGLTLGPGGPMTHKLRRVYA